MAVKILIKRRFKVDQLQDASSLMMKTRYRAMRQPGYLSSETLTGLKDPGHVVVASLWETEKDWNSWRNSTEREEFETEMRKIQVGDTEFEQYILGWQIDYD